MSKIGCVDAAVAYSQTTEGFLILSFRHAFGRARISTASE